MGPREFSILLAGLDPRSRVGKRRGHSPAGSVPLGSTVTIMAIWKGPLLGHLRPPGFPKQEAGRGLCYYLVHNHVLVSP